MNKALCIGIFAFCATGFVLAQTANDQASKEIENTEQQLVDAGYNHDANAILKLVPPNAVAVYPSGLRSTEENAKRIGQARCKVLSKAPMRDVKVIQFDQRTAVITYLLHWDSECNGKRSSRSMWSSDVYIHDNGKWEPVFHQVTPTEEAAK